MTSATPGHVLVTGATGFVGRDLIGRLAAEGWRVRAAARDPAAIARIAGVDPVALPDLAAPDPDWSSLLPAITHVAHLAGLAHMTATIPEATYVAVNATATTALALAARRMGVRRLVLVSSVRAQTGPIASGVVRESDPPRPSDAYGRSKLAGETGMWQALAGGATAGVVLRPVLVHGPGVKGNLAALARIARLPLPLPFGALHNRRSLVSLANLASAIAHTLVAPSAAGGTFLVADPTPISTAEMIAALRAGLGRRPALVAVPLAPAAAVLRRLGRGDVWDRIAGDLVVETDALQATGWRATEDTVEALARCARTG